MLPFHFHFGQVIDKYLREARSILAAAPEAGGGDAVAALGLVDAALELSPRMEAALELRARALRWDYIPSCSKACSGDDTSSSSSSAAAPVLSSGSGDLCTISRVKLLSPDRHRSDDAEPARPFLPLLRHLRAQAPRPCRPLQEPQHGHPMEVRNLGLLLSSDSVTPMIS